MRDIKFVYRVVYKKSEGYFMFHLIEDAGKLYFISKHPSTFSGYTELDLQKKLFLFEEALKLPIVNYEDLKEYTFNNVPPPDRSIKNYKD